MKKLFFTLALVGACLLTAQAQDYKSAIGLRLGSPWSVSYKQFISEPGAIEAFVGFRRYGILGYHYGWVNIGALYQHHFPISSVEGLKWYVGGGASVYFWNFDDGYAFYEDNANLSVGILGNVGLDYKFADAPVNLSLDWVPAVFLNGYGDSFGAGYYALSARYTFR